MDNSHILGTIKLGKKFIRCYVINVKFLRIIVAELSLKIAW